MSEATTWDTNVDLDPRKIQLDVRNPRIEVSVKATQDEIRLKLLEFEGVLDLARSIVKTDGLLHGERIITTVENDKQIVLEGNRRVAACQMLLNPKLVPMAYASRFPEAPPALKRMLRAIPADVSPSRQAAEHILTKRHTEPGAKQWSPVAKMRRAVRLLDRMSVDQVAETLGTTPSAVKRLIRPYRLLKYAIDLPAWSESERHVLENEKLKTNPYTRFFTLADTQRILQLSFDDNQNPVSTLPEEVFREQMTAIARDFLIPDPAKGEPLRNTRTQPLEYFSKFLASSAGKAATKTSSTAATSHPATKPQSPTAPASKASSAPVSPEPTSGSPRPKTPKASVFFEKLECHVRDENLIALTKEIRETRHASAPISASLLLRALFECALNYKLRTSGKWVELLKLEREAGRDPALASMIKFAAKFDNGVFIENKICKVLAAHTTAQAKDYLDSMTHLRYQQADPATLETIANNIRGVIQYILEGN